MGVLVNAPSSSNGEEIPDVAVSQGEQCAFVITVTYVIPQLNIQSSRVQEP